MELSAYTRSLLADIERRIDPETEEDFIKQWEAFWAGNIDDVIFTPKRKKISEPGVALQRIYLNEAIDDLELMLDMQLAGVSRALQGRSQALSMRANYGTGIMTSLFGAPLFMMEREKDTLPTTHSLNDTDAVRAIVEAGMPPLTAGLGQRVFDFGEMCREVLRDYPKLARYVTVYHPDTQGPLDIAELLWGGDMFYEMYDDPDFVQRLMRLITDTYCAFMDKWFQLYPIRSGMNVHWGFWHRGTICLRNDSAINLSPAQYREFALPYDTELLDYYGGGILHYCGRGDHFVGELAAHPLLYGINLSQPHLNDMDKVFSAAFSNDCRILDLTREACAAYAARPDAVKGMVFCY